LVYLKCIKARRTVRDAALRCRFYVACHTVYSLPLLSFLVIVLNLLTLVCHHSVGMMRCAAGPAH
jgi:hypothetical protein